MKHFNLLKKTILICLLAITSFNANAEIDGGGIRGIVYSSDNKPVGYVSVKLKEENKQTITSDKGMFRFRNLKAGTYTVIITYVGHNRQEQQVVVADRQVTNLSITLPQSITQLGEVVISSGKTINNTPVSLDKSGISPLDLPQSTGVVTNKVIEDQQINRLGDAVS